jgi:hypothetical protein
MHCLGEKAALKARMIIFRKLLLPGLPEETLEKISARKRQRSFDRPEECRFSRGRATHVQSS